MKIKEIEKTVTLAWSPSPQYPLLLAAGTAAQQLDASFNTSAVLEIYGVDLGDFSTEMQLYGSINSNFRFHKIVWGSYGYSGDMEKGYIVGGCDSGNIVLYSASQILNGEHGLVATQTKHTGAVRAMDFNSFQKNLLATGASNSEIFIWDMNSTKTPMTPGAATQPLEDILALAWNKQVQHILGTVYSTRCVVWDLRKNEPIIKLSDSASKIKWKDVVWNPDVATQLCLASEDDNCPVIQLWDLRFATSPIKTFEGHQKGVLSLSWCEQDPDLLISCGKDNKLLVWNPNTTETNGEVVGELPIGYQWNFDISWCPRNPFLIASSSFDGHACIYSLSGGQPVLQTSSKIADSFPGMNKNDNSMQFQQQQQQQQFQHQQSSVELRKPPKWLKRPCGASFGFGGKLVTYDLNSKSVHISSVVTKPGMLLRAKELENVLERNADIISYCYKKSEICPVSYMKDVWNFVSTQFFKESTKPQMCRLLGTSEHYLEEKLNRVTDERGTPLIHAVNDFDNTEIDSLQDGITYSGSAPDKKVSKPDKTFIIKGGNDIDAVISDALLLGKLDIAVQLCLKENRMAEALILAIAGGPDLIAKVQSKFFEKNNSPLSDLISAVVTNDWINVVQNCDLKNWKQILVSLLTYTRDDDYQTLCDYLGERLECESDDSFAHNALICYVCSGNINQLIESCKKFGFTDVQELTELALVMNETTLSVIDREFASLLLHYGELLSSEGFLECAVMYLENINNEAVISLKERIRAALGTTDPYPMKQEIAPVKSTSYFQQTQSGGLGINYSQPPKSIVKPYSSSLGNPQPPTPAQVMPPIAPQAPLQSTPHALPTLPVPPSINQFVPPIQNTMQPYSALQTSSTISNQKYPSRPPSSNIYSPVVQNPVSMYQSTVSSYPQQQSSSFQNAGVTSGYGQNELYNGVSQKTTNLQPTRLVTPPPPPQVPYTTQKPAQDSLPSHGRSKYLVDPSVQSPGYGQYSTAVVNTPMMMNASGYSSQAATFDMGAPTASPMSNIQSPSYSQLGNNSNLYNPSINNAHSQQKISHQTPGYIQTTVSAGWNDPPPINYSNASVNNQVGYVVPNPITQPLPQSNPQTAPPPFNQFSGPPKHMGYDNNVGTYRGNSTSIPQMPPQMVPVDQMKQKPPFPEELVPLQNALEDLRNRCYQKTNNPQMKHKLEDVARKLELLYDCIREQKLSPETVTGLRQIVEFIFQRNYEACLSVHSSLVSGPQFSVIACFMPGVRTLIQCAMQLQVYLL